MVWGKRSMVDVFQIKSYILIDGPAQFDYNTNFDPRDPVDSLWVDIWSIARHRGSHYYLEKFGKHRSDR